MSGPEGVSAIVFVLNEEENLPYCLDSLTWCDDVHVVDSFSTDSTLAICRDRGVRVAQREFDGFGGQRNWALESLPLKYDWVLILDADERVPPRLAHELGDLAASAPAGIGAFRVRRRFHLWGKWLRYSSLYPTWVVRFVHKERIRYINRGHAETQEVDGAIGELDGYLIDENRKSLREWFARQNHYSDAEARFELESENAEGSLLSILNSDPLRRRAGLKRIACRLPFRGTLYFLYCYVLRLGFLDGRDGYAFCRMKAIYQTMIDIKKYDARRK